MKTNGQSGLLKWISITGAAGTAVIAALGLLGYLSGLWLLGSVRTDYIPMAPATAVSFIVLSLLLLILIHSSSKRGKLFLCPAAALTALFGLLEVVEHFTGRSLRLEELLFPAAGHLNGIPIGRMSPVTGFSFFISGTAVLLLLLRKERSSHFTYLTGMLGSLTFVTGSVYLSAYLYGHPLMYGHGAAVPMALTTSAGFVLLGASIISRAGRFKQTFFLGIIALCLMAGIVAAGILSYKSYEHNYRTEAQQQLLAIAELKVNELVRWRKERSQDGTVFFKNDSFSGLVRRFFEQPEDADPQRQLLEWMSKYLESKEYGLIRLLDAQGVTRLSLPAEKASAPMPGIAKVLKSGQVTLTDFYRNENDQHVYLSVLVPIFDGSDTNRPLGLLALRIDPSSYLYPFIQRWPVPSDSAETLIVRREGNEAVFLNELRFQTNTALNLRISLESTNTPAVMAALGVEGIFEGRDYRGRPVISALHVIPDSPWFMVARRDTDEVFAPVRERLRQVAVTIGILIFGTTACVGLIWRHQRVRFYRERMQSAEALYETNAILQTAMEQSSVGIAIADAPNGKLRYVNDAGLLIGGRSRSQLVDGVGIDQYVASWKIFDLDGTPFASEELPMVRAIKYGETSSREFIIRRGDHDDRVVLAKAAPITNVQGQVTAGIVVFLDITERIETMQKLSEAMEHLRISNRDLEQFAYIASHDLQEPLRMVANYMQLIERRYKDKLDQDAKDFIGYAVDGAVRMQQLIDSLLDYSRLQTRKNPFEMVNLDQVLQRVLRDLEGRIVEAGAQITADPLPQVYGDALQIGLVFQNLITNAIKFRGQASPKVHISASEFPKYWKLTVRDNGIGIAQEHQDRIFKIFQRLHSRAEYPGTGIGLAICRRIIERHGGETGVESELTKGSAFWFTLPKKGEK